MTVLATLLMVVGTGCHLVNPKSICANGIWITSIMTATLAVLAASNQCEVLRCAVLFSVGALLLFVMIGMYGILKEVKGWPED